jgi:sarcosine oxidase subunit alpha
LATNTRVLTATIASLLMDQNGVLLAQRIGAHLAAGERGLHPEQRLWHVRARTIILATGALERPIVFPDNDRPGIMLASAARAYLRRQALAPERGVVFTTNDDAYRTALAWRGWSFCRRYRRRAAGGRRALRQRALDAGLAVHYESEVVGTVGDDRAGARVLVRTPTGTITLETDLLAVSGGYEPNLNLHLQLRGATRYDPSIGAAVPAATLPGQWIAGAASGQLTLADALRTGVEAAHGALAGLGRIHTVDRDLPFADDDESREDPPAPSLQVASPDGDETRSFVDLHRDATVAGVQRAVQAGVRHIEHVKRFTLVGTGVEQGRTARPTPRRSLLR